MQASDYQCSCGNKFDLIRRTPILLQCDHILCQKCIFERFETQNYILCDVCQSVTMSQPHELKQNQSILQKIKNIQQLYDSVKISKKQLNCFLQQNQKIINQTIKSFSEQQKLLIKKLFSFKKENQNQLINDCLDFNKMITNQMDQLENISHTEQSNQVPSLLFDFQNTFNLEQIQKQLETIQNKAYIIQKKIATLNSQQDSPQEQPKKQYKLSNCPHSFSESVLIEYINLNKGNLFPCLKYPDCEQWFTPNDYYNLTGKQYQSQIPYQQQFLQFNTKIQNFANSAQIQQLQIELEQQKQQIQDKNRAIFELQSQLEIQQQKEINPQPKPASYYSSPNTCANQGCNPLSIIITLNCKHSFCCDCLSAHLYDQTDGLFVVNPGEKGYQTKCLVPMCNQVLSEKEIKNVIGEKYFEYQKEADRRLVQ